MPPAPPISALEPLRSLDPSLVSQVRQQFLSGPLESYDPEDVETIRSNDWQVQRFLLEAKKNPDQALKSLRASTAWRKEFGVKSLSSKDFPVEYYKAGYMIQYGRDVNGAKVVIFRSNIHRKISEWNDTLKRFFVYNIEMVDRWNDGKGVTLVLDCAGSGVSNLDLDLLKFIVTSFSSYYPKLFDAIVIHELPYLLQYVFKLIQSWLPEDDRKFFHLTTKKTLNQYVSVEQLPSFMNGTNRDDWRVVPEGVVKAEILAERMGLGKGAGDKLAYLADK